MRWTTICLAALLGLGLAVPAAADHERKDRERRDRQERVERHDRHAHEHRRFAPRHVRKDRVYEHALALERQTKRLRKRAGNNAGYWDRGERKAIRRLRTLEREARDFRISVEEHRRLRGALPDYFALERAFVRAAKRFDDLHACSKTRRTFRRVRHSVADLSSELHPVIARRGDDGRGHRQVAWARHRR